MKNMRELLEYNAKMKKERANKWNKERGEEVCKGFTQKEFNASIKFQTSKVKNRTRRVYAKGTLWNHNNLPRIKPTI
jgi:pterin-4a-carbinolamine dehydratase